LTTVDHAYFRLEHVALEDGAAVIALHGELDDATSLELRSTLGLLGQIFGAVVVDLSGLVFCDSHGLRVLFNAHERLLRTRGRLTLRSPTRPLERMLAVTGLDEILHVEDVGGQVDGSGRPSAGVICPHWLSARRRSPAAALVKDQSR
jgi:anti-sigma B factor antagonist